MSITRIKATDIPPLTEKDHKMIKEAAKRPITFDEDCPETTDAEFAQIMCEIAERKSSNDKIC